MLLHQFALSVDIFCSFSEGCETSRDVVYFRRGTCYRECSCFRGLEASRLVGMEALKARQLGGLEAWRLGVLGWIGFECLPE